MKIIKPNYFDDFKCKADRCIDSCCSAGWQVDVDAKSLDRYCSLNHEFLKDITNYIAVNKKSKTFKQQDGHCVFFKNGLCELVLKFGDKALCDVCRDYPRFYVWQKDICLMGLSLDCEEVANLILNSTKKVCFNTNVKSKDNKTEQQLNLFFDVIGVLQDKTKNIHERISTVADKLQIKNANINSDIFDLFDELEWLNFDGQSLKNFLKQQLLNSFIYDDEKIENLLVYFVYRYFLNNQYKVSNKARFMFALFCTVCCDKMQQYFDTNSQNYYKFKGITTFCRQIEYSTKNVSELLNYFNK